MVDLPYNVSTKQNGVPESRDRLKDSSIPLLPKVQAESSCLIRVLSHLYFSEMRHD